MLHVKTGVIVTWLLGVTLGRCEVVDNSPKTGDNGALDARYCIIGGGPAGIQLGHFFLGANRSYRIFEKSHRAGSFFAEDARRMPVHRRLISINKRFTGARSDPEFNMRHDWNSLLGDHVARVTNRTRELYPPADVVADYIQDFAGIQIQAGRISFNTEVLRVSAGKTGNALEKTSSFLIETSRGDAACQFVIVAAGFQSAVKMNEKEEAFVEGYDELKGDTQRFEGKDVVVLGGGNAAYETIESLVNDAKVTHISRLRPLPWKRDSLWSSVRGRNSDGDEVLFKKSLTEDNRPDAEGTRMAMMTHYVGDVRAHRLGIFDSYSLKMVDRVLRCEKQDALFEAFRCWHNKVCLHTCLDVNEDVGLPSVVWKRHLDKDEAAAVQRALQLFGTEHGLDMTKVADLTESAPIDGVMALSIDRAFLASDLGPGFFPYLERASNVTLSKPLSPQNVVADHVIRCFGWKINTSMFDPKTMPIQTTVKGKYPVIYDTYEVPTVPGLFFAGTLAHSLDFKKSAGGFIHGFRYAVRSLFRSFEAETEGVPWPSTSFVLDGTNQSILALRDHMLNRINVAAGPYQMFGGTLIDGIVLNRRIAESDKGSNGACDAKGKPLPLVATYYDEMPPSHFFRSFSESHNIVWHYKYGKNFSGPGVIEGDNVGSEDIAHAHFSTFLHPKVELFGPAKKPIPKTFTFDKRSKPLAQHWIVENVEFDFSSVFHKAPLLKFLQKAVKKVEKASGDRQSCDAIRAALLQKMAKDL